MIHQVGNTIFDHQGKIAIVTDRDENTHQLTVESGGKNFERSSKYPLINGLKPQERKYYNDVMDQAYEKKEPIERIKLIRDKLKEIPEDPNTHILRKYISAEMAHIMNTHRVWPREYTIAADKVT